MIGYRPEIDGMRALAVVCVLVYHANFQIGNQFLLSGGYLGVDVFFVISGYLITSFILAARAENRFKLANFYERRARRILPALFLVMAASLVPAWYLMLPEDFESFGSSGVFALLFGSNFWFWSQTGYAAEAGEFMPLLHTWTLAIEEQFYVIFPLVVAWIWRRAPGVMLPAFVAGFLASLIYAHFASVRTPDAAFYLLPARAWELLAGAILAAQESKIGRPRGSSISMVMNLLGIVAILASVVFFSDATRHPSLFTLVPVAGTMAVIWFGGRGDVVSRALSSRPLVFTGLVSYSLYLWHYPVFSYLRIAGVEESVAVKAGILVVSFLLAWLSYRYVETPARRRHRTRSRPFVVGIVATSMLLFSAYLYVSLHGLEDRLGKWQPFFETSQKQEWVVDDRRCTGRPLAELCVVGADRQRQVLLVGDSHARALSHELQQAAQANGWGYREATMSACLFMEGILRTDMSSGSGCALRSEGLNRMLQEAQPMTIVYATRLPFYLGDGADVAMRRASLDLEIDREMHPPGLTVADIVVKGLNGWIGHGHKLVLVYPVPEPGVYVPKKIRQAILAGKDPMSDPLTIPLEDYRQQSRASYRALNRVEAENGLARVYPEKRLCSVERGVCYQNDQSTIFYSDDNHLSHAASKMVVADIVDAIASMPP